MISNSSWTEWGNFKLAERVAGGGFEMMSMIFPELYDMKSDYQLIVSIKNAQMYTIREHLLFHL